MPHKQVTNNTSQTGNTGWVLALERAELALYKNRGRRMQIMEAIRFFEEQIKNREPWPRSDKKSKQSKILS
jgi:hypothetical protein